MSTEVADAARSGYAALSASSGVEASTQALTDARTALWHAIKRLEHLEETAETIPIERFTDVTLAIYAVKTALEDLPPLRHTWFRRKPYRKVTG